jgi:serine/threonine-protein kinase
MRDPVVGRACIDDYRLEVLVGEGWMGEVWKASHKSGRTVALKLLRRRRAPHALAAARFAMEVTATGLLQHPNVVRLHEHGVTAEGTPFYAMEFLSGENVADLVGRCGPLPPDRVAWLLSQAAAGLGEAHRNAVVHRDIKPDNVVVTAGDAADDQVKVVDFGIALLTTADKRTRALLGEAVGTPEYMAPEMLAGAPGDTRTDLYALGGVGYFMLTGQRPIGGRGQSVAVAKRARPPAPSAVLGRPVPGALEALVLGCLDPDPEVRPSSAAQVCDKLRGK